MLYLVGDEPPKRIRRLATSDIIVTGRVPDVTPYLDSAALVERCGATQEVGEKQTGPFAKELQRRFGFRANFTHFAVLGECKDCAAKERR
jgi:hypothetical protein